MNGYESEGLTQAGARCHLHLPLLRKKKSRKNLVEQKGPNVSRMRLNKHEAFYLMRLSFSSSQERRETYLPKCRLITFVELLVMLVDLYSYRLRIHPPVLLQETQRNKIHSVVSHTQKSEHF